MIRFFMGAIVAVVCGATSAQAEEISRHRIDVLDRPSYDRNLELAVKEIVARKIGTIRGRLDKDVGPVLVEAENPVWPLSLIARNLNDKASFPADPIIYASITH
ncbi:hypothetical protein GA830_09875 [Mesorhizobium sp. NBSH29]|uniref:hypothetical protein n=1 Tax=Mesorhizobium sp. NBSH29 TaxID=2654249 RepID=UPI001896610C|nr:hypothetical protein [Mesorhizobium sp. NBSH29]QPC87010.1 hypothetical protein GA830_09875 [Mesorhizobium sp. NBSH29]